MKTLKISFASQRHHHGKKPVSKKLVKSGALARLGKAKLTAALEKAEKVENASEEKQRAAESKPYGSHDGSTQVMVILEEDFEEQISGNLLISLTNVLNKHEAKVGDGLDMKLMKRNYTVQKTRIEAEYEAKYGQNLSTKQLDALQNEIAQYGFDYYSNQIVVQITSDEEFEGATPIVDKATKEIQGWVMTVHSKSVFTSTRPSYEEAAAYVKLAKSDKLIERVVYSLGMTARWVPGTGRKAGHYQIIGNQKDKPGNEYTE